MNPFQRENRIYSQSQWNPKYKTTKLFLEGSCSGEGMWMGEMVKTEDSCMSIGAGATLELKSGTS